jgi:hypothetical protein
MNSIAHKSGEAQILFHENVLFYIFNECFECCYILIFFYKCIYGNNIVFIQKKLAF